MLIGARTAAWGGGKKSPDFTSYSQIDLIHQYDGEQNTRLGFYEYSTKVEDLVGSTDITINSGTTFSNKRVNYDGTNANGLGSFSSDIISANTTLEMCIGVSCPSSQYSALLYNNSPINLFVINKSAVNMGWDATKPGLYVGGTTGAGYQPNFNISFFTVSSAYDENKNCTGCYVDGVDAGVQFNRTEGPLWSRDGRTIGAIPGYSASFHFPMWLASLRVYAGNKLASVANYNAEIDVERFNIT